MDQSRFDEFVKRFADTRSRRGVLKVIAGGAASVIAVTVGIGDAAARGRPVDSVCRSSRDCESGRCIAEGRRKICHCRTSEDCPVPTDPCATVTCVEDGACKVNPITCPTCQACAAGECVPTLVCDLGCCSPGDVCALSSAGFTICCPAGTTVASGDSCCPVDTTVACDSGCCSNPGDSCTPGVNGPTVCCPAGTTVCGYDGCCGSDGEVCMTDPVFGVRHCCPADTNVVCESGCCFFGEVCVADPGQNTYCCPPWTKLACSTGCCVRDHTVCAPDSNFDQTHCCPRGATAYCESGGCCVGACDPDGNCVPA